MVWQLINDSDVSTVGVNHSHALFCDDNVNDDNGK